MTMTIVTSTFHVYFKGFRLSMLLTQTRLTIFILKMKGYKAMPEILSAIGAFHE
jgi:hypothetical protein